MAASALIPTKRTIRFPSGRTSSVSTDAPAPNLICLPGRSALPGFPIATQVSAPAGWMSRSSAGAPDGRVPSRRACRTRVVLSTRRSPGGMSRARSPKWASSSVCFAGAAPADRCTIRSRLPPRSGDGSWAISSVGSSYSKSVVRKGSGVKDGGLDGRWLESESAVGQGSGTAAPGSPLQKALLNQIGLVHILQSSGILADGYGHCPQAYRTPAELFDDGGQNASVHVVQPELIHIEPGKGRAGYLGGDPAVRFDFGIIADPGEQAGCHPGSSPAAPGNLVGAGLVDGHAKD